MHPTYLRNAAIKLYPRHLVRLFSLKVREAANNGADNIQIFRCDCIQFLFCQEGLNNAVDIIHGHSFRGWNRLDKMRKLEGIVRLFDELQSYVSSLVDVCTFIKLVFQDKASNLCVDDGNNEVILRCSDKTNRILGTRCNCLKTIQSG